jgi:putative ABC transport system permease protein
VSAVRSTLAVLFAIAGAGWREHPGRVALSVLGIAFGVALGVAVHLINASAASEFDIALRSLAGEADLVVRGPRGGFSEGLYPRIARLDGVRAASPALEIEAQVAGRTETIKVLGLDPFRAGALQPHLLVESRDAIPDLLESGAVLLSHSAADTLGLARGDSLRVHAGTQVLELRIAALMPAGATQQRLALMDIAAVQWRFGRLGTLNRIDVKLAPGADPQRMSHDIERLLPPGTVVASPAAEAARNAALTRAYRTNLDMLALVALFTGAFLVFSTQFLALLRRRSQLAVLRVIGLTRGRLTRLLVLEGALVGVAGAAIGVAAGCVVAWLGLERLGGDLGAGYFRGSRPSLAIEWTGLVSFFALGVLFSTGGALLPALEAGRRSAALALKAGDQEEALRGAHRTWLGIALAVAGLGASQLPASADLPIAGYIAVALILLGTILAMPAFATVVLDRLPAMRYVPAALGAAQLQATPRQVGVSLAAILASFSLMVSMLIMIGSFRESLGVWLDQMLPADLYVRAGRTGDTGFFTPEEQQRLAAVTGVREAVFVRSQNTFLRRDRLPITLLARPTRDGVPFPPLPLEGPACEPRDTPSAWLSEVAADLLGATRGARIAVPVGESLQTFVVCGIWRDYARQNGAIVIDRALYMNITGDERANEAALFLAPGAESGDVSARLRAALADSGALEIASTRELKSLSLAIFDRTFAVTYALEAAAVLIGLFGVSASFSAQALARRREFGVLRHLGMTRKQIGAMLASEGLVVGALGVVAGLATGWVISLILIHVINRQSFHWSMDLHMPWGALAILAATLIAAASVTALVSGRRAMSDEVTRAVREDW